MGDFHRTARSSGLRFLLRLASVVAALVVLSMTSRASAATSPAVPMCGERGESIDAPPIFRAYQPTIAFATPCHQDELVAGHSAPLAPERIVVQERPERVLGFGALGIAQSESSRLAIATTAGVLERPGFVESLFRPPRA
ncbi:MAG TPA: hypothetical protein VJN18_00990 [Polyangiaceae bacterium]|nr:hypothetical protein [Polyangiaceae bacterium]